jgi:lipopolysaccharide transport system ATP-binding protein
MSSDWAIQAQGLSKCYTLFDRPADRLKQMLWRGRRTYYREFWALRNLDLEVGHGEVLGIVGRNGAGKSTLLQLLCGTLTPTQGTLQTKGRVAALLELGAGFNQEFSGRENIYLLTALNGLSREETDALVEDIVAFSGIRDFIDQPVKTYSSGMFVRLAFAIATSVDPDILVIDEALSVGDGKFARRSFDRIMQFKERGKTILFCSHSLYQVEALCNRVAWIEQGTLKTIGQPAKVVSAYGASLNEAIPHALPASAPSPQSHAKVSARITHIQVLSGNVDATTRPLHTGVDPLTVQVCFSSDPALPTPSIAMCLASEDGRVIASAGTVNDGLNITRAPDGQGSVRITFPALPLLKGNYWVHAYLLCERALHIYESVEHFAKITMEQQGLEIGVVSLPHIWEQGA